MTNTGKNLHLNNNFKRFWTFVQQYDLIDDIEVKPLKPLISTMFEDEKKSPSKLERSKSDTSVSSSKEDNPASPKDEVAEVPKETTEVKTQATISPSNSKAEPEKTEPKVAVRVHYLYF